MLVGTTVTWGRARAAPAWVRLRIVHLFQVLHMNHVRLMSSC